MRGLIYTFCFSHIAESSVIFRSSKSIVPLKKLSFPKLVFFLLDRFNGKIINLAETLKQMHRTL